MRNVFRPAGLRVEYDIKVPMRDGVNLSLDVYFPLGEGPWPVILIRTPYNNQMPMIVTESATYFAQNGYAVAAQDVRGRFDSEGEFVPWVNEFDDGFDTLEWIGDQEWCDGNIGMHGPSYVGNVQWQAAAMGSRYLKTIVPRVIGDNLHESPQYQGGAFQLGWTALWSFFMDGRSGQSIDIYDWTQVFHTLPIRDLPELSGKDIAFYREWCDHPDYDEYWKSLAIKERYGDVGIPVMQVGGWYDFFTAGTFINFAGMTERGGTDLARENQRAIVGPWVHQAGRLTYAGDKDFGFDSTQDLLELELGWFDRWLRGRDNGADGEPPLKLFVMGENVWRNEREWPLARTDFTPWYLHSGGDANSVMGDGVLSALAPAAEPTDSFVYNPMFPVPTRGGCNCCNPEIVEWGAYDQREVEARSDVLVYTSEPLAADMEVTGPVVVKLYASTDGPDTDFTAKLVDVHPDGHAVNLCDGIIRGRYREGTTAQRLLEPVRVYEFTIDLWPTSNVFKSGHRIRVDISSSNFPRFDRNPNTGNRWGVDAELRIAHQTVYHDEARPSHIVLPIIPAG